LTFSPDDPVRDRWLQRSIHQSGTYLAGVRERIIDAAEIKRHGILLDLNAGTGLLTWEAVRRTPEGSVWALAGDEKTGSGLSAQALNLEEMDRPVIMVGPLERIRELVLAEGEGAVRFDAVVGRNALLPIDNKVEAVEAMARVLAPDGTISLVEGIPRLGQRIYNLTGWEGLDEKLVNQWISAEEAIYEDSDDPMVNWNRDDLSHAFDHAGLAMKHFHLEKTTLEIRVTDTVLTRWFPEIDGGSKMPGRPSYRERLSALLSPDEVDQIRRHITKNLAGNQIPWTSESVYLVAAWK
ncbi:MAG: AAA family ATPase, partial [Desulfobacteraceae bacterium 4572_87]